MTARLPAGGAGWSTLTGAPPRIIAHRGASGLYPEHTMPGYQQALDDGADVVEPDLLPSRDGVLFCRHDIGLARSTDIATRARFASRGQQGDWRCFDFDALEIDELRAVQPFAQRPQQHNGEHPPPRFNGLLDWAGAQASTRGREVLLYPEIKEPALLQTHGVDPLPVFIEAMRNLPAGVRVLLQCFDVHALRRLHEATGLPCALLVDSRGNPRQALAEHGGWLRGLALSKKLLRGGEGADLLRAVHERGLWVDAWTFRDDQPGDGFSAIQDELRWAMLLGVDALFCDYPATAVAVRHSLR